MNVGREKGKDLSEEIREILFSRNKSCRLFAFHLNTTFLLIHATYYANMEFSVFLHKKSVDLHKKSVDYAESVEKSVFFF